MDQATRKTRNDVTSILEVSFGKEITQKIIDSFNEIETNFRIKKWKPSELDAGHFVESVRRLIELELFGTPTPFSDQIEKFTEAVLKKYEQAGSKHESFRILIPRILWSMYSVRNKRGVGHISSISPNEMDATLILYSAKWILAEIIRIKSNLDPADTHGIVDLIVEREIPLLWRRESVRRIMDTQMSAREQVFVLLYDEDALQETVLKNAVEYRNPTLFRTKIIMPLHTQRFIEYDTKNRICYLTHKGTVEAERIITESKLISEN